MSEPMDEIDARLNALRNGPMTLTLSAVRDAIKSVVDGQDAELQAARQEIERYKVALEVATESASKLDKRLALADRRNPMMYRTPFSYAEEALADADVRFHADRLRKERCDGPSS